ncbi:MAG TPA: peptide deformylase [Candidatus Dormibacteraeota bacterium]|nr:peptide deformylase [Candidatus Dormibacteraeota bacterium]
MAQLGILTRGNPRLHVKAKKVGRVDDTVRRLMDDMVDTMGANAGVGLAATQVGVSQRVIVMKVDNHLYTLANPEILRMEGEQTGYEGCLSVPGLIGEVTRAEKVVARALNRNGREVKIRAAGLLARCIQHEIDHLDGILFLDRVTSLDTLRPVDEGTEEDEAARADLEAGDRAPVLTSA